MKTTWKCAALIYPSECKNVHLCHLDENLSHFVASLSPSFSPSMCYNCLYIKYRDVIQVLAHLLGGCHHVPL